MLFVASIFLRFLQITIALTKIEKASGSKKGFSCCGQIAQRPINIPVNTTANVKYWMVRLPGDFWSNIITPMKCNGNAHSKLKFFAASWWSVKAQRNNRRMPINPVTPKRITSNHLLIFFLCQSNTVIAATIKNNTPKAIHGWTKFIDEEERAG